MFEAASRFGTAQFLQVAGAAFAATVAMLHPASAGAQAFPSRPVTMVVPYGAGTGIDILARQVAPKIAEALGQAVVIDNKPGAGAIVGTNAVVRAAADGYTLLFGATGTAINPFVYKQLPYDASKDLITVARISNQPLVLVVNPSLPVTSVPALIEHARKNPGKLNYAGTGVGSSVHLSGAYFASVAKLDVQYVNYNNFPPLLVDMQRGEIGFMFYSYAAIAAQIKSGQLRALATTSDKRAAFLPDLPTMLELGYKDFIFPTWQGIFAPARTPRSVVDTLYAATAKALSDPDLIKRMLETGTEARVESPEQFDRFVRSQAEMYREIVAIAKVPPQQ